MSTRTPSFPPSPAIHAESDFEDAADALPHILWTARPDGLVDYLSKAYTEYIGTAQDIEKQSWLDALHPEDVERCKMVWSEAIATGRDYTIEFRIIHRASGQFRWQAVNAKPVRNAHGQIIKWYGIAIDIHDSKLTQDRANVLARRLQATLECMSEGFFMLDHDWCFVYLNSAAQQALNCRGEDWVGQFIWDKFSKEQHAPFDRHYRHAVATNCSVRFEEFDASLNKWFELDVHPSEQGLSVYFRDITERKHAALELERTSRGLRMLSHANAALVRIEDEEELLQAICQVAQEGGDYRAAWAGIAQDEAMRTIKVPAWAGDAEIGRYISGLELSWSEDTPLGRGPTGRVMREGKPFFFNDTLRDPAFEPWWEAAEQSQYLSGICLPLHDKGRTFGVLVLVNYGKRTMSDNEVRLLQELAENLGCGITHLRAKRLQRQMESAMVKVATAISTSSESEFFHKLVLSFMEAVGADGVFLTQLLQDEPGAARVIAGIIDGHVVENFRYEIEGTPCEKMLAQGACIVDKNLREHFPAMAAALPEDVQACAGHPLDDANGHPMGTLFMVSRNKIDQPDFIRSMLQIFAARAASELERQEKDARIHYQASLLDKARDAIVVRDMEHRILFWNKGAERLYGWRREEVMGRLETELSCEVPENFHQIVEHVLVHGRWNGEQIKRHRDGSQVAVDGSWTLVRDEQGRPQSIFSIHTDISERKAAEHEIQRLAFYDQLTGLPNRQLLRDRLHQAVRASARTSHPGALMFLDLDNFKELNDIYGHDHGDLLLRQVANRLAGCVRECDTVARLGGDEFVVVLETLSSQVEHAASEAESVAEKVWATLNQPYELEGCQHISTPSIGLVMFDGSVTNIDELLKHADLAMYRAKSAGRNTIRFYDPDMQAAVIAKAALEADLRESLEKDWFALAYQPQLDSDDRLIGMEALVRWKHPARMDVPPSVFIPLAEESHLILDLGRRVLERACMQLAQWAKQPDTAHLTLAVNISARQFRHPSFVNEVVSIVRQSGIDAARLKLELTESMLVEDTAEAAAKMAELQGHGIGFSLDDFGTGYSSLSYLRRLPIEQLKIDRSFIAEVPGNESDVSIVEAIIALARKLGLHVIAEGVETLQQRDFLCRVGCHAYQGYYYSQPMNEAELAAYLEHRRERAAKRRYLC
jgi:diguanylate cyclase (GGDEF)-like protein/PAS domain S-box-containing protein